MIILSAAQDLVGSDVPKGAVLLADVLPAFFTKLVAPYFIHRVPHGTRVLVFALGSTVGMLVVALTPSDSDGSPAAKMLGIALASFASGGGELSFLGLTHYYGRLSLAAWGSGTGAAGIVGAGLYVLLTELWGLGVRDSLLASAALPAVMLLSFFAVLPRGPLRDEEERRRRGRTANHKGYDPVPDRIDDDDDDGTEESAPNNATTSLLAPPPPSGPGVAGEEDGRAAASHHHHQQQQQQSLGANLRRARALFVPYMLPLFLVYVAEYTINQGIAPVLLFPLASSPFAALRDFYPMYGLLYQVGVFVSRTSVAWVRVRRLYAPALLQVLNAALLAAHALWPFLPSVWVVFAVVFWEGLLGGAVYVNTFAAIMEAVAPREREFSLGATSVSDSAGICTAGFLGMAVEVWLCNWQVRHGRDWCKQIGVSSTA